MRARIFAGASFDLKGSGYLLSVSVFPELPKTNKKVQNNNPEEMIISRCRLSIGNDSRIARRLDLLVFAFFVCFDAGTLRCTAFDLRRGLVYSPSDPGFSKRCSASNRALKTTCSNEYRRGQKLTVLFLFYFMKDVLNAPVVKRTDVALRKVSQRIMFILI